MTSKIVVNNIEADAGINTVTFNSNISGNFVGNVITTGVSTFSNGIVVSTGTTAAPSISPTGDSNTGIFFPSADTVAIAEGGVEALRVTSSGDIGIGTATPSNYFSYDLVVKSRQNTGGITIAANSTSDTNYLMFADGTSGNAAYRGYINYVHSDDSLNIASAGSVRATLDSSGRFLLGATSARTDIPGGTQGLLIEGTSSTNTQNRFTTHVFGSSDTQGPYLGLGKTRSTSLGGNTIVQNGDEFGAIYFHGSDGSTLRQGAYILASSDGTPGAADMPGRLSFATTPDGASSPTERLRIASNGAWGLSGANYGSSGEVLTSNGSGSAPTWQGLSILGSTSQTWTNVLSSRSNGTTYTNSTGRPIMVILSGNDNPNQGLNYTFQVQGNNIGVALPNVAPGYSMIVGVHIVPNGQTYRAAWNGSANLSQWWELR